MAKPKLIRHPLTVSLARRCCLFYAVMRRFVLQEDPFAGAVPADTATQEVIFGSGSAAAAASSPPQVRRHVVSKLLSTTEVYFLF